MDMEQKVEQRAKAILAEVDGLSSWRDTCRRIARAELEREGKLVTMLKQLRPVLTANGCPAWRARAEEVLAAYEAEFAPKRTLAQVAADALTLLNNQSAIAIELAEALRREGGERG